MYAGEQGREDVGLARGARARGSGRGVDTRCTVTERVRNRGARPGRACVRFNLPQRDRNWPAHVGRALLDTNVLFPLIGRDR